MISNLIGPYLKLATCLNIFFINIKAQNRIQNLYKCLNVTLNCYFCFNLELKHRNVLINGFQPDYFSGGLSSFAKYCKQNESGKAPS